MFYANRRRIIKKEAAGIIFLNLQKFLIIGALILAAMCGVSALVKEYGILFNVFAEKTGYLSFYTLLFICAFMLLSPLFFGIAEMFGEYSISKDKNCGSILKYYYDKNSFLFSIKNTFFIFILLVILCVTPSLLFRLSEFIIGNTLFSAGVINSVVYSLIRLACIFLFFCVAVMFCGFACFFRVAAVEKASGKSVLACAVISYKRMKCHKTEFLMLNLSFIPLFAISYLSFGILFAFSVPYYLMTVNVFVTYVMTEENMPVFYSFA